MSDWGVHLIDMALWTKDIVEAPKKVITYASNLSKQKMARETFDTMNVIYPKDDFVINYDLAGGVQQGPYNSPYGIQFVGELGMLVADRGKYHLYPEWDGDSKAPKTGKSAGSRGRNHIGSMLTISFPVSNHARPPRVPLK